MKSKKTLSDVLGKRTVKESKMLFLEVMSESNTSADMVKGLWEKLHETEQEYVVLAAFFCGRADARM